jgi:ribosomal protein S18 acetylase RimI-like enzyme
LRDTVEDGASVGFLPPLASAEARDYWRGALRALSAGTRVLLVALDDGEVLGAVQLDLATTPNGRHRAEVMKLMVHRRARGKGIGRALMLAAEDDTRRGDAAERLYERLGYSRVGVIPRYARSAAGTLDDTVYFYREL